MRRVKPHEYFRLDFDQILEEGKQQEELLAVNKGEFVLVKNIHGFFDTSVLPLINSNQWVWDAADQFAKEYALDCIHDQRLTGRELYENNQKLLKLKDEIYDIVARIKLAGYIDSFGSNDLDKMSDFINLIPINRIPLQIRAQVDKQHN